MAGGDKLQKKAYLRFLSSRIRKWTPKSGLRFIEEDPVIGGVEGLARSIMLTVCRNRQRLLQQAWNYWTANTGVQHDYTADVRSILNHPLPDNEMRTELEIEILYKWMCQNGGKDFTGIASSVTTCTSRRTIVALLQTVRIERFAPGEPILFQGTLPRLEDGHFTVLQGSCDVLHYPEESVGLLKMQEYVKHRRFEQARNMMQDEAVLATMVSPAGFGELSTLTGVKRAVTVRASYSRASPDGAAAADKGGLPPSKTVNGTGATAAAMALTAASAPQTKLITEVLVVPKANLIDCLEHRRGDGMVEGAAPSEAIELFRQTGLAARIGTHDLMSAATSMRRHVLYAGDVLYARGEPAQRLFIVVSGELVLDTTEPDASNTDSRGAFSPFLRSLPEFCFHMAGGTVLGDEGILGFDRQYVATAAVVSEMAVVFEAVGFARHFLVDRVKAMRYAALAYKELPRWTVPIHEAEINNLYGNLNSLRRVVAFCRPWRGKAERWHIREEDIRRPHFEAVRPLIVARKKDKEAAQKGAVRQADKEESQRRAVEEAKEKSRKKAQAAHSKDKGKGKGKGRKNKATATATDTAAGTEEEGAEDGTPAEAGGAGGGAWRTLNIIELSAARALNAISKKVLAEGVQVHARINILQDQLARENETTELDSEEEEEVEAMDAAAAEAESLGSGVVGGGGTLSISAEMAAFEHDFAAAAPHAHSHTQSPPLPHHPHPHHDSHHASHHSSHSVAPHQDHHQNSHQDSHQDQDRRAHAEIGEDKDKDKDKAKDASHASHAAAAAAAAAATFHASSTAMMTVQFDAAETARKGRKRYVNTVRARLNVALKRYLDRQEAYVEAKTDAADDQIHIGDSAAIISMFKSAAAGAIDDEDGDGEGDSRSQGADSVGPGSPAVDPSRKRQKTESRAAYEQRLRACESLNVPRVHMYLAHLDQLKLERRAAVQLELVSADEFQAAEDSGGGGSRAGTGEQGAGAGAGVEARAGGTLGGPFRHPLPRQGSPGAGGYQSLRRSAAEMESGPEPSMINTINWRPPSAPALPRPGSPDRPIMVEPDGKGLFSVPTERQPPQPLERQPHSPWKPRSPTYVRTDERGPHASLQSLRFDKTFYRTFGERMANVSSSGYGQKDIEAAAQAVLGMTLREFREEAAFMRPAVPVLTRRVIIPDDVKAVLNPHKHKQKHISTHTKKMVPTHTMPTDVGLVSPTHGPLEDFSYWSVNLDTPGGFQQALEHKDFTARRKFLAKNGWNTRGMKVSDNSREPGEEGTTLWFLHECRQLGIADDAGLDSAYRSIHGGRHAHSPDGSLAKSGSGSKAPSGQRQQEQQQQQQQHGQSDGEAEETDELDRALQREGRVVFVAEGEGEGEGDTPRGPDWRDSDGRVSRDSHDHDHDHDHDHGLGGRECSSTQIQTLTTENLKKLSLANPQSLPRVGPGEGPALGVGVGSPAESPNSAKMLQRMESFLTQGTAATAATDATDLSGGRSPASPGKQGSQGPLPSADGGGKPAQASSAGRSRQQQQEQQQHHEQKLPSEALRKYSELVNGEYSSRKFLEGKRRCQEKSKFKLTGSHTGAEEGEGDEGRGGGETGSAEADNSGSKARELTANRRKDAALIACLLPPHLHPDAARDKIQRDAEAAALQRKRAAAVATTSSADDADAAEPSSSSIATSRSNALNSLRSAVLLQARSSGDGNGEAGQASDWEAAAASLDIEAWQAFSVHVARKNHQGPKKSLPVLAKAPTDPFKKPPKKSSLKFGSGNLAATEGLDELEFKSFSSYLDVYKASYAKGAGQRKSVTGGAT